MPVLVLCAKLCPQGIEGTLFALLMSISNFSISVSEFWGALICSWLSIKKDAYENLWLAVLIRSCLKIIPIFFLFLIPTSDPQEIIDNLDFDGGRSSSGNCHTGNDDVDPDQEEKESEDSEVCGTIRPNHTARADSPDETKSYV
jgi:hypothetical protein